METNGLTHERKDFRLDQGLPLPGDALHRVVEERHHVFLSPEKASYVVTDAQGARLMELLLAGAALGTALNTVKGELALDGERTADVARQLLLQIEKNGFYQDAAVVDDVIVNFPILCYLTKLCNLACTHCYVAAGPRMTTDTNLSTEQWKRVFSDYAQVLSRHPGLKGKITLTGGEPLTRRDFFELADAAGSHGVLLELFSNGTLIRDAATARRVADRVDQVQISLDGASEAVNDFIRGPGSFRRIVRALGFLAETDVRIRLAVTLMPANAADMEENLMAVVGRFGAGRMEIRIGLANVQGRADTGVRFADGVEGEKILRRLLARLYDQGMRRPRNIIPNFRNSSCGYGRSLNIASDGTVYACAIEVFPIGNVRETPLSELGPLVRRLDAESEVDNIRGCRACELRYFCNGGCRLNNYLHRQSLFVTCCTREKKTEILHKLVYRELADDAEVSAHARVGSFWHQTEPKPRASGPVTANPVL